MQWFEYLIIVIAISFVFLVTFFSIRNKLKAKKSGTAHCSGCSSCHSGGCPYCNQCKKESLK